MQLARVRSDVLDIGINGMESKKSVDTHGSELGATLLQHASGWYGNEPWLEKSGCRTKEAIDYSSGEGE